MIVLSEHMMLIWAIITENQYSCVQYLKMKLDQGEFHKTESCVMPNRTPTHRRITNKTINGISNLINTITFCCTVMFCVLFFAHLLSINILSYLCHATTKSTLIINIENLLIFLITND